MHIKNNINNCIINKYDKPQTLMLMFKCHLIYYSIELIDCGDVTVNGSLMIALRVSIFRIFAY